MMLEFGAEVIDSKGEVLGTIDHLARNLSTGEIRKFVVRRKGDEKDLFLTPDDVLEATEYRVKLKLSFEELSQR